MEKNKENKGKVKLNDELLDRISGGTGDGEEGSFPRCQTCGNIEELAGLTVLMSMGDLYTYQCNQCGNIFAFQWN